MRIKKINEAAPDFTPIEVTIIIETQEEVDALTMASTDLCMTEIDSAHEFKTRCIWVDFLDELAGALK